ncbi:MAG: YihY/virulence factor BrkB family protein [Candidatus Dormibacteraeota bacterium]|nr:YihY/virulence factor BrkB family protein [Candidatus Dormibacteraeota bacterium]
MRVIWNRLGRTVPARVVSRYLGRNGPNQATLIAWNLLFATFPLVLLAVTAAGELYRDPGAGELVARAVAQLLPGGRDQAVLSALRSFHRNVGWTAVVGGVGLVWSGTSLFSAMDTAFSGLSGGHPRGFLAQKLTGVGLTAALALLAGPVVLSSTLLAALPAGTGLPAPLRSAAAAAGLQALAAVLVGWILFSLVYRLAPAKAPQMRATLGGALVGAVLFELLSLAFPLYLHLSHGFAAYGATFALFFLILAFVFLAAQVTVVGFCVVLELEPETSPRRTPEPPGPEAGETDQAGEPVRSQIPAR